MVDVNGTNTGAFAEKVGVGGGVFLAGVAHESGTDMVVVVVIVVARCLRLCKYSWCMWLVLLAARFISGVAALSKMGEGGEKSAINLCARLDLRLLMGLGVVVGDSDGGAACASHSVVVVEAGPWFSA